MRPLKNLCEVAVIGGGLAGLFAARHVARSGRLVTLFEGRGMFGGQVATVDEVDGLAMPGKFAGQDLAIPLLDDARKANAHVEEANIARLDAGHRLTLTDEAGKIYRPEVVIIASGASLRKLGVAGEEELTGRGVSRCATCDGGFFRGQDVAVVGGGDAAVQEALVLVKTSRRVIMVCRSPMRARRDYVDKLDARENVEFVWDSEVAEILGKDGVTGLRLKNVKTGAASEIECAGVFPFIGVEPNSTFVPPSLLDANKLVATNGGVQTTDPRIFAVGAVRSHYGGHVVQAMAEGITAAEAVVDLLGEKRQRDA
jgi:thioredoxin reductase (NADPH)